MNEGNAELPAWKKLKINFTAGVHTDARNFKDAIDGGLSFYHVKTMAESGKTVK